MSLSAIKKKVEKIAKEYVRRRDQNLCQMCGKYVEGSNCHVSHVIPVSHGNVLRFDHLNMKVLCFKCHIGYWHKNILDSAEWFKNKFPDRWVYLQRRKEEVVKFRHEDYEQMIKDYELLINQL